MNARMTALCGLAALALLAAFAQAGTKAPGTKKAPTANETRFEALKNLAGDWLQIGEDGKLTDHVLASIKVTAGGSVVQETLFPGEADEMVTMYHLDGPDLVLTHYCSQGNQPRMKAEAGGSPDKIAFKFAGVSNLKTKDELRMDHATIVLVDKDHYQAEWVACKDGAACHTAKFNAQRKK